MQQPIINITNIFIRENYSWVDQLLAEQYHRYALTADNAADMMEAGLLQERWAWADQQLQQMWNAYITPDDGQEYLEVQPVPLERSQAFSEPIPIDISRQSLPEEEEDHDSNLLARKHFWYQPMDIDIPVNKRLYEGDEEDEPMSKKHRTGDTVFIPIANQPMDLAAEVDEDEDSLCEAFYNCSINPEAFVDPFAMDEDLVADDENMDIDEEDYESDEWPHWNN